MTYPTSPALNSSEAEYPSLWDGLVWAYLPGYNKNTTIVGGDTLSGSADTTIDSYAEGLGETIPLGKYRQGAAKPLEDTFAASIHAYYRTLWTDDGTMSGILSTAPSTTWQNVGVLGTVGGLVFAIWRRAGVEAFSQAPGATGHTPTVNPVVNSMTWRNSSVVGVRDTAFGESTAPATALTGSLTNTEPVIVGSYYDKTSGRSSSIAFFCGCVWSRDLTLAERDLLQSDPYAVFRKGAGDATAPTLTSPTATATGATTASGSVSTTEGNGTLYYLATINASEDAATVKAGSSQAVSASGEQPVTVTGLTASTSYYLHFVHTDAAANDSAVSTSGQFTTAATNTSPSFTGPNIADISGTEGVALIPVDVSTRFSDAESGLTFSAIGSWPAGVTVSSAGVISGTPTTTGTYASLQVRATAAGSLTADSNAFMITVAAPAVAAVAVTEPLKNNTGMVLASQSGVRVAVLQAADLVSVFETSGLTTNASGVLGTISAAAIIAGQQYHVAIKLADGSVGITGVVTAS